MRKVLFFICLLLMMLTSFLQVPTKSVLAQDEVDPELQVTHVNSSETSNGLKMQIYFTLRDKNRDPVPAERINAGTLTIRTNQTPIPVELSDPDTPMKIVLVLDASGSMTGVADQLRRAAADSIDKAPTDAQFAVVFFSEVASDGDFSFNKDFSDNREEVKNFIREQYNPKPLAKTCLFNVTYRVAQLLQSSLQPQERRAIIVFTDGKDEGGRADGKCSDKTAEDAISQAAPIDGSGSPIYGIGMCRSATDCGNVDTVSLERMTVNSKGNYVYGTADRLSDVFFQIMDIIRNQKVASVLIEPCQESQATLNISAINVGDNILGVARLPKNYPCYAPTATAALTIENDGALYLLKANNTSPVPIQQFRVEVLDPKNTSVFSTKIDKPVQAGQELDRIEIKIDNAKFKIDGKYTLQISAIDPEGIPFRLEDPDRKNTILTTKEFEFTPSDKQVGIQIISRPEVDYKKGELFVKEIRVDDKNKLLDSNKNFLKAEVSLLDGDVVMFQSQPQAFNLDKPEVRVPLAQIPPNLIPTQADHTYAMVVKVLAPNVESVSDPFSFVFPVQVPPTFFEKFGKPLLGILFIAIAAVGMFYFLRKRKQNKPVEIPAPYTPLTGMLNIKDIPGNNSPPSGNKALPPMPQPPVQAQPAQQFGSYSQPANSPNFNQYSLPAQPFNQPVQPAQGFNQPMQPPAQGFNQPVQPPAQGFNQPMQPSQPYNQTIQPAQPAQQPFSAQAQAFNSPSQSFKQIPKNPLMPQPQSDPTQIYVPQPSASEPTQMMSMPATQPRLRLKIVNTPNQNQPLEHTITQFPKNIGRNAAEDIVIDGDKSVSRHHAKVDYQNGTFVIIDDNSGFGLHMGQNRLQANTPVPINGRTLVKIGQFTEIELEPLS